MTLEEIFSEWERDAKIDSSELALESLRIPILHHQWLRRFSAEKMELRRVEAEHKAIRHKKLVFYTQGPDEETHALGWRLPPRGKILKAEAGGYVDSDPDVMELGQRVALQVEKVSAIEEIIRSINSRSFLISNSIKFLEFTNGR